MARFPLIFLSTKRKKAQATNALPDELVVCIFRLIAASIDTSSVYRNLVNLQPVCKQWNRIAKAILYSRVEVAISDDTTALERTLNSGDQVFAIDTLAIGMAEFWPGIADGRQFHKLVEGAQSIAKLIIFHADYTSRPRSVAWSSLPHLPSLLDATITSAHSVEPSMTTGALVYGLPSQLRFLQLPGSPTVPSLLSSHPPSFRLYGLSIQEYPSRMAQWVLSSSSTTLQCLTVGSISDVPTLAANHPNLRSLRILSVHDAHARDFYDFLKLERLELRAADAPRSVIITLPNSIRYLRFWSTDLAEGLEEALLTPRWRSRHPDLQIIAWDYWEDVEGMDNAIMRGLMGVCEREGIELRMYRRTDGGRRASEGHDLEFEASFRASCFASELEHNASSLPASLRQPASQMPTRVLANLMSKGVSLGPLFDERLYRAANAHLEPLLEDCFYGHLDWVTRLLPRAAETRNLWGEDNQHNGSHTNRKEAVATRLGLRWAEYFVCSSTLIFVATTVIYFTVLRSHPGPRLGLAFGAAVIILALRASLVFVRKYANHYVRTEAFQLPILNATGLSLCYVWILAAFIFFVSSSQAGNDGNSVVLGLSLAGGFLLLSSGAWIICDALFSD